MREKGPDALLPSDEFLPRHIGPRPADIEAMLALVGYDDLDALVRDTVPDDILMDRPLDVPEAKGEFALIHELRALASKNQLKRNFIGLGYYDCITPPVIQRNILENPGWYTQYTPYQAEISQGRLEALLNFQTMVADLTGLPLANSSLLDEATAAAEAMSMSVAITRHKKNGFFVADDCHPQTIAVVETRAKPLEIDLTVAPPKSFFDSIDFDSGDLFGILLSYPTTDGRIEDYEDLCRRAQEAGVVVTMVCDLLALTLLRPPGELGCDIAIGNSQRLGVPLGAGGPHAAFLATRDEHARRMPGRIVGVSKDAEGRAAYRLAVQTREQHIRRDKATSNICTAQVLLAIMASMYGVYHGPEGLTRIARRVHGLTKVLADALRKRGLDIGEQSFFDTLRVRVEREQGERILTEAVRQGMNLRAYDDGSVGVSLDETATLDEVEQIAKLFGAEAIPAKDDLDLPEPHRRTSEFMTHGVFHKYRSEHELLRYIYRLQARDLSMTTSMISLGSCTMKLNATTEMLPATWPELGGIHPFAPNPQTAGYDELYHGLEDCLMEITGFAGISLQPNAGSQGEYAGLLVIRAYHQDRGDTGRNICLIPVSAHGTNPASAVMAGFCVVVVDCDERGNVDVEDLKNKADEHRDELGALMITYPSTHGVFEERIREICQIVHDAGGQVYMDGANMNAQVGLTSPGLIGADVCHLNLHKTFCIPHGGGGPGVGPIGVASHLVPFLPGHPLSQEVSEHAIGPVSAAPYGSPSILPISWSYIRLMGPEGLTQATRVAILNANYMAKRLEEHYPVLYTGAKGRVAHEFILDCRPFHKVSVEDIAKRLMDYGFHAPTMSFPVAGTLMIEPTESESKEELDRLCDALISIRAEVRAVEEGTADAEDNVLKNAPHTAAAITSDDWSHPYTREQAVFPAPWLREHKFWPPVARIDNAYGDRNLVCVCPPIEAYA
ncbi:MAG: aminomethyl-transferring glycine dehydrogenase [Acidobacteriota bacterium]|nr:MAG: aminomethyl-transferring glycine dehydrogenase [Acidobacteriota bacterium]